MALHHLHLLAKSAQCTLWDNTYSFLTTNSDEVKQYAHIEAFERIFISAEPHVKFSGIHRVIGTSDVHPDILLSPAASPHEDWVPGQPLLIPQILIFGSNSHERNMIIRLLKRSLKSLGGCIDHLYQSKTSQNGGISIQQERSAELLIAPGSGVNDFIFYILWKRLANRFGVSCCGKVNHGSESCFEVLVDAVDPIVDFLYQQITDAIEMNSFAASVSTKTQWMIHMHETCSFLSLGFESLANISIESSFPESDRQPLHYDDSDRAWNRLMFVSNQWQQWIATAAMLSCGHLVDHTLNTPAACSGAMCWAGRLFILWIMNILIIVKDIVMSLQFSWRRWSKEAFYFALRVNISTSKSMILRYYSFNLYLPYILGFNFIRYLEKLVILTVVSQNSSRYTITNTNSSSHAPESN